MKVSPVARWKWEPLVIEQTLEREANQTGVGNYSHG